jgi:hypothetical protein
MAETTKINDVEEIEVSIEGACRLLGALGADLDDLKTDEAFRDFLELHRPAPEALPWDLRDMHAITAMQAHLTSCYDKFWAGSEVRDKTSKQAYRWADAMLSAKGTVTIPVLERLLTDADKDKGLAQNEATSMLNKYGAACKLKSEAVEALKGLVEVIEAAGLINLSNGVQLGPTVWFVKASDAIAYGKGVIAEAEAAVAQAETAPNPEATHA